jgi:uncharacterized membrane protein YdjX (TVP38/TMEM64 family)
MSQTRPDDSQPSRSRAGWRRGAPLLIIAAIAVTFWFSGVTRVVSLESLIASREAVVQWVGQHLALAMLAFFLTYLALAALCVPGVVFMTVVSGFLFGVPAGVFLSALAATTGGTILFLIARTSFGNMLCERAGPRLSRLRRDFHADAASYMLFLRLTPAIPFWLVNLASALLGVELATFIWTTFLGIMPATFAFAFAGMGLDSVIAAQQAAYESCVASGAQSCIMRVRPTDLVTRELVLALAALGLLALLPVLVKRWRSRKAPEQAI